MTASRHGEPFPCNAWQFGQGVACPVAYQPLSGHPGESFLRFHCRADLRDVDREAASSTCFRGDSLLHTSSACEKPTAESGRLW
jgi:hypothetical protein